MPGQNTLHRQDAPPERPLWQKLGWFAALYAAGIVTITAIAYAIRWGLGLG